MALTVIGIPIAIRKYVDWTFVQQEIIFNDRSIREAMREQLQRGPRQVVVDGEGGRLLLGDRRRASARSSPSP